MNADKRDGDVVFFEIPLFAHTYFFLSSPQKLVCCRRVKWVKKKKSWHAQRRAKLYGITESSVVEILTSLDLRRGEHQIVQHVAGFQFPVKVVFIVEGETATVVTNYVLKKRRKR